jgi:hypothetical protein
MYPAVIATLLNSDIGRLETIRVLVCQDTDQFSIQSSEFIVYAAFERSRHFGHHGS